MTIIAPHVPIKTVVLTARSTTRASHDHVLGLSRSTMAMYKSRTNGKYKIAPNKRKKIVLNWMTSPSSFLPHGVLGLFSVTTGAFLSLSTLTGSIQDDRMAQEKRPLAIQLLVYTYFVSTFLNAVAGLMMVRLAPVKSRTLFRLAGVLQCSLVYFAWRFYSLSPERYSTSPWRFLDFCGVGSLVASLTLCSLSVWRGTMFVLLEKMAVTCGVGALMLLSGYPLQLALQGASWYDGVLQDYPRQREAFVFFVYIPTTWAFAVVLFGATLYKRGLVSLRVFGSAFIGLVCVTLLSTVTLQEVYLPCVSTQKLILFTPKASQSAIQRWISGIVDTSVLAQYSLLYFFPDRKFGFTSCN